MHIIITLFFLFVAFIAAIAIWVFAEIQEEGIRNRQRAYWDELKKQELEKDEHRSRRGIKQKKQQTAK